MHFEYISNSVSTALMDLQLKQRKPVIYGVLNVLAPAQAAARASPDSQLGASWARSALTMIGLVNSIKTQGTCDGE